MKTQNKINLGDIYLTPGVIDLVGTNTEFLVDILSRHSHGDWGALDEHDTAVNEDAVASMNRVLSVYKYEGNRIYVITEAGHTVTTVLLPEEY